MHIHILGICGTFMGSLAVLAKQQGHKVSGSDSGVYPPMSTQLESQGIELCEGYCEEHLQPHPDLVIVGNALSRGNEAVEYVLNNALRYTSGPQWLADEILHDRWVLGVAGTHGKTTTSAMLTWVLKEAGLKPGYLIGGVVNDLPASADSGDSIFFVVEADEYDSAFFDKRSKFVHYAPRTVILNNLEFDHADIFSDLGAIQKQFHHLLRTVPGNGLILAPRDDPAVDEVLDAGCWTSLERFGPSMELDPEGTVDSNLGVGEWSALAIKKDWSEFEIEYNPVAGDKQKSMVSWPMFGIHNARNALAAVGAAHHVGVLLADAAKALSKFNGVKRRMELLAELRGIYIYDDFAHHPTAIATTLEGLKVQLHSRGEDFRVIAIIEPGSNTMRGRTHQNKLSEACSFADEVVWKRPLDSLLDFTALCDGSGNSRVSFFEIDEILSHILAIAREGDHIVVMSNSGFDGIHKRLIDGLASR
ncbi:MAG: UDP-N-acetylmuramate:L-alanyl-gamma-D-glutamyl-meso-diaminopimelate ligase [Gammaproteobacteria bacterium]|nr:UDP-N-acetylmuramate:L-alanyl-gamma-D-glutamyl-meso-diaminopimelate ligase [Gammaproteobacteria bacterium]|tara:strand:+ start:89 stop:1513 length:1425 start_codon:yes stop_codon:yes gene_type:complete